MLSMLSCYILGDHAILLALSGLLSYDWGRCNCSSGSPDEKEGLALTAENVVTRNDTGSQKSSRFNKFNSLENVCCYPLYCYLAGCHSPIFLSEWAWVGLRVFSPSLHQLAVIPTRRALCDIVKHRWFSGKIHRCQEPQQLPRLDGPRVRFTVDALFQQPPLPSRRWLTFCPLPKDKSRDDEEPPFWRQFSRPTHRFHPPCSPSVSTISNEDLSPAC